MRSIFKGASIRTRMTGLSRYRRRIGRRGRFSFRRAFHFSVQEQKKPSGRECTRMDANKKSAQIVQKNNLMANWKFRGPPVLKIGLKPAPLLLFTPRLLLAMTVVAPNAGALIVPPCGPKLG